MAHGLVDVGVKNGFTLQSHAHGQAAWGVRAADAGTSDHTSSAYLGGGFLRLLLRTIPKTLLRGQMLSCTHRRRALSSAGRGATRCEMRELAFEILWMF